ncbi:MAG TPA: BON domain-containing protein [Bryobacteraceae bacterium]
MRTMLLTLTFFGGVLVGPAALFSQQNPQPDNTRVNRRDRSSREPTADQGKNNASDRDIMQKIRRSVMDDKSLSTYAHNVKIISQNGRVTLKGPVRSEDEKQSLERKAREVAGEGNVVNQLTVKPKKTS